MRREAKNAFNKTFYIIEYNRNLDIVDTLWYGYSSQTDLRKAMQIGLELHQEVKCAYKLNDNTMYTGPWADAVAWLQEEWLPKAMQAGVKYLAHVAAPDSFGETAGEIMQISAIGQQLNFGMFQNKTDAITWLQSCQEKEEVLA